MDRGGLGLLRTELGRAARDLAPTLARLPAYIRLGLRLLGDGRLAVPVRIILAGAALYAASPLDAVPGFVPVLGQLDDLIVALTALRLALERLGPGGAAPHLAAAGLSRADLDRDLFLARQALRRLIYAGGVAALGAAGRGLSGAARWLAARLRRQRAVQ